jgi:hypothetical protein
MEAEFLRAREAERERGGTEKGAFPFITDLV